MLSTPGRMVALLVYFFCGVGAASWFARLKAGPARGSSDREDRVGALLPKLLPHEDTSYLLEFHSDNCDHCEQMEPVLQRLEADLGTKIRRINIFRRREFYGLIEAMGHDECGGLPFYYNRRTGQAICGATTYNNLKKWGTGSVKHMFQDAPDAPQGDREARPPTRKDVGAKQMFVERMQMMGRRKKSSGAEGRGAAGDDAKEKEKGKAKSSGASSGAGAGSDGPTKKESAAAEHLRERRKLRETRKQEVPQ